MRIYLCVLTDCLFSLYRIGHMSFTWALVSYQLWLVLAWSVLVSVHMCVHTCMHVCSLYVHIICVYIYSGTCIIQHPLGRKNSAGLAGCWIVEVSLNGK